MKSKHVNTVETDRCRFCSGKLSSYKCELCGSLNPRRNTDNPDINSEFTDYSYNRYDDSIAFKAYSSWIKFSAFIFSQPGFSVRLLKTIFSPLLGGSPKLSLSENERILDIGCGRGFFLRFLPKSWEIMGTDIVNYGNLPVPVVVGNFENFPEEKKFTIVRSSHSLEHATKPALFLKKAINVTENGGILVISSPNGDSMSSRIFKTKWLPFNVPSHFCLPTIKALEQYLNESGCRVLYKGTYTLFSSSGSLMEMFGVKKHAGPIFVFLNIILIPLTLLELISGRGDSLIIYAKKV